jgi:hypothetical protein
MPSQDGIVLIIIMEELLEKILETHMPSIKGTCSFDLPCHIDRELGVIYLLEMTRYLIGISEKVIPWDIQN